MPFSNQGLGLPPPLGLAVVLAIIAIAIYAVRAHGRRHRRHSRRARAEFARLFSRFIDRRLTARELLRAVEAADEALVWTVLESLSTRLNRPRWIRLSRALLRSRHAAAERRALADDSPWRRCLAARRLALLRSRASWRALRRAMVRGPEMVTMAAATALARYRDRGALRWIIANPGSLERRNRNALVALLRGFGRSGLPVISGGLLRGVTNPRLELAMIDTLGLGGYRPGRPSLEQRLMKGDLDVRVAAARGLGLLQAVECATTLIHALKDDDWQVRAQAARALGRVRAPLATHALAARLTDPSWWVRHHAAYALMEMGEDGQNALRQTVAGSKDPYARDMAREALEGGIRKLIA
jgi:HEAT repeat protein